MIVYPQIFDQIKTRLVKHKVREYIRLCIYSCSTSREDSYLQMPTLHVFQPEGS